MRDEYGTDDMEWLMEHSERPGTVTVSAHGRRFFVPVVRFDNRIDRTSFLRADQTEWDQHHLEELRTALADDFARLAQLRAAVTPGYPPSGS